jgi:hypothetical protein
MKALCPARGFMLEAARRRRRSSDAHLLAAARELCDGIPSDSEDQRIRAAIASLTRVLEDK